jgi:hypothetical protein
MNRKFTEYSRLTNDIVNVEIKLNRAYFDAAKESLKDNTLLHNMMRYNKSFSELLKQVVLLARMIIEKRDLNGNIIDTRSSYQKYLEASNALTDAQLDGEKE